MGKVDIELFYEAEPEDGGGEGGAGLQEEGDLNGDGGAGGVREGEGDDGAVIRDGEVPHAVGGEADVVVEFSKDNAVFRFEFVNSRDIDNIM